MYQVYVFCNFGMKKEVSSEIIEFSFALYYKTKCCRHSSAKIFNKFSISRKERANLRETNVQIWTPQDSRYKKSMSSKCFLRQILRSF